MAPKSRENGLKVWKRNWDKGSPVSKNGSPFCGETGFKFFFVQAFGTLTPCNRKHESDQNPERT